MAEQEKELFPERMSLDLVRTHVPKYGSNPGQRGAFYAPEKYLEDFTVNFNLLDGPPLSANNRIEARRAYKLLDGFQDYSAVVTTKHGTYSGFGVAQTISRAGEIARQCNPRADFGGVFAFNRKIDLETAKIIGEGFTEVICAPAFDDDARTYLNSLQKKKMRLVKATAHSRFPYVVRVADGEFFFEERPNYQKRQNIGDTSELQNKLKEKKIEFEADEEFGVLYVTKVRPTRDEAIKLLFAQDVVWKVHSNGIFIGDGLVKDERIIEFYSYGFGTDVSRVGACEIAVMRAGERAKDALAASDGSFPYSDGPIHLYDAGGVKHIIQPGGSIRDKRSINAANRRGTGMVMSGRRLFEHP